MTTNAADALPTPCIAIEAGLSPRAVMAEKQANDLQRRALSALLHMLLGYEDTMIAAGILAPPDA